ncbi:hypothetical protein [Burkholderia sp. MBR-1]|uniref:hypothetical protein n=1 Tax=Burkholderia sp. MBR-1 TaxID=2732364 RepID=UPI0015EE4C0F|nr:hypothetical protein [Burkholderia sp. MBR-1]QMI49754.1 hypothetical protein MBR110_30225 [Burkholderia sp. MBR-1]
MGNLVAMPIREREAPNMLSVLLEGAIDGFNKQMDASRFDKASTRVMMGYLSAASIALRCNGLDEEAQRFLEAATAIEQDWTRYEPAIRALAASFGYKS